MRLGSYPGGLIWDLVLGTATERGSPKLIIAEALVKGLLHSLPLESLTRNALAML